MFHPNGPTFWELAEQCLSSTERGYDLLAPKFDVTPFRTPDFVLDGLAKCLGEPRSIDSALDVCCGTGAAIRILRPLCRERVVGIDFSQGMLEIARRHFPECGPPQCGPPVPGGQARPETVRQEDVTKSDAAFRSTLGGDRRATLPGGDRRGTLGEPPVEFVHGDVLQIQFREEFELAITAGSLGHVLPKDEPRFVERIHAALRPGGRFAFVTAEMPPWWSRRAILSRAFNAAMHIRNTIRRPPFIMYYLTFLLPEVQRLLESHGFTVAVHNDAFQRQFAFLKVVVATKRR